LSGLTRLRAPGEPVAFVDLQGANDVERGRVGVRLVGHICPWSCASVRASVSASWSDALKPERVLGVAGSAASSATMHRGNVTAGGR
jgi:hypothetical protein